MAASIQEALTKAEARSQAVLSKTLEAWSADEEVPAKPQQHQHRFKPTTNVSRASFEYVKRNPGMTQKQACKALAAQGFNPNSVSSLLPNMVKQSLLRRDEEMRLFAVAEEYKPLKSTAAYKAAHKTTSAKAVQQSTNEIVKGLLNSMSVLQAKEVFNELRAVFER